MHDVANARRQQRAIFLGVGSLLVLTAMEVVLGYKQIFEPVRMLEVLLVLSIIKSALIIGYFMHLKFENGTDALDAGALGDGVLHHHVFLFLPGCGTNFAAPNGVGVQ